MALRREIALVVGAVVAGLEAAAQLVPTAKWLQVAAGVVIAMAGALGVRQNVQPVTQPPSDSPAPPGPGGPGPVQAVPDSADSPQTAAGGV